MRNAYFLIGFDTEVPYGSSARTNESKSSREDAINTIKKLNSLFDSEGINRTHFILGDFLEAIDATTGRKTVNELFNWPLIDIQQHTYSHQTFREIVTRPDKKPLTAVEIKKDIEKASSSIARILNKSVCGLRAPLGYACGMNGESEKLDAIKETNIRYISSDLRDKEGGICPPLMEDGILRQPYKYENGLIEIPSHGWQDTAFLGSKTKGVPNFPEWPRKELECFIVEHYTKIMQDAIVLVDSKKTNIFIGGCFHPQAISTYDPDLELFAKIIDNAKREGVKITSYSDVLNQIWRRF